MFMKKWNRVGSIEHLSSADCEICMGEQYKVYVCVCTCGGGDYIYLHF